MSAQKSPRRGIVSAIAGLLGFSVLAGLLVTVMVAPAVAVGGVTASSTIGIFDSMPDYLVIDDQRERNELYAANGEKIATIFNQNRETVTYDQISPFALDAAVDGEDRRFFEHGGVDVASVIRAAVGNVVSSDIESGASTLSMQLVKNIFVQRALEEPTIEEQKQAYADATATSFDRKLTEMKYAIGLEKRYTKKEILTAYLNIAFFGSNTYGIQAAAQRYYSVNASDLTLAQAASLIAIVQYPGLRSLDDPENYSANQDRRDVILYAMYDVGDITRAEYDEARAIPVDDTTLLPQAPQNGCIAANTYAKWFCDFVVKSVKDFAFLGATEEERKANWARGGYKLYTTLDMPSSVAAYDATHKYAPNTEERFQLGSATSMIEPGTGRLLVMTQNKDFDDTLDGGGPSTTAVNFNTAYAYGGSSGFQVGSTYKLFTLVDWLIKGHGVNEQVNASGRTLKFNSFPDSCPDGNNEGNEFTFKNDNTADGGSQTVRRGTVYSVNGVFFSMAQQLDFCDIHKIAKDMGVETASGSPIKHFPSAIIGSGDNNITPLSMAVAYSTIAAQGLTCSPIVVDRATGPGGEELGGQEKNCKQAIPPEVANTVADVMKGVMNFSFARIGDGVPVFGKTGTTNNAKDTWAIASSSYATSATWVGNIKGEYNIQTTSYGGTRGDYLRMMIMKATLGSYNSIHGGNDWPAPPQALLNGASAPEVPNVTGLSLEGAKGLLEGLGYNFEDGGQVDSELEAGRVVNTDPGAGTKAAKGTTVKVFTSKGNKVSVPDTVGNGETNSFSDAQGILAGAGFTNVSQGCVVLAPTAAYPGVPGPGGTTVVNPTDPRLDMVQSMSPGAGSFALPTDGITVTVGKATCP